MKKILSILILSSTLIFQAKANATIIHASDDATVYQLTPNTNDNGIHLRSWRRPDPDWVQSDGWQGPPPLDDVAFGFLKFDLSSVPSIAAMTLNLGYMQSQYPGAFDLQVQYVADDSWSESLITWNTMPTMGDVIASRMLTTPMSSNTLVSFNLLSMGFNPTLDLTDNSLSLALNVPIGPGGVGFFSAEHPSPFMIKPYLEVIPVPEPTTIWLIGTGLCSLLLKKRS